MNTPLDIDQIKAMNETLADYCIESSKLLDNDQVLAQHLTPSTPDHILKRAKFVAETYDLSIDIRLLSRGKDMFYLVNTYRLDYEKGSIQ